MDWIRRNWPDLLIGFALLAVISGIVATLLTGGSFFPGQNQPTSAQTPRPPALESQNQPGQADPAAPVAGDPAPAVPPGQEQDPLAEDGPVDPFAEAAAEEEAAAEALADTLDPLELPSVVALRPGTDPEAVPQAPSVAQQPAGEPTQDTPAQETQQAPAQTQTPATVATAGELPSSSVPYTVGVGAFRDQGNAERQASVFRQAGYPVVVASQDDFTVVLLGPYGTRSEADRISSDVNTGGFGVTPIVYTYQGDGDAQQASASAQDSAAATQQPAAAADEPVTTPVASDPQPAATATAAGRYLQVGAYSSSENATLQAGQLEQLGYEVMQEQDGNLIRVLVGPFGDGQLTGARDRLAAQGIDSVPR